MSAFSFTRARAITNDIVPLRISQRRTAEAGEYASAEGVETREWCMTMDSAAFWTAKVTKLGEYYERKDRADDMGNSRDVFERHSEDGGYSMGVERLQRTIEGGRIKRHGFLRVVELGRRTGGRK